jgi:peptidoglycan/xylan/chitin deacetylase (PgdA/CDA1 family)
MVVRIGVVSLIAVSLVIGAAWQLSRSRAFQVFCWIVSHVEIDVPLVGLTFDDGPTAEFADEALATLREQDVRATLFVTGREQEESLDAGRKIVAEGHELGSHS